MLARTRVEAISEATGHMTVTTSRGTFEAENVVITAGPWAAEWLPSIASKVMPERQVVGWFAPHPAALFQRDMFPIFIVEDETGNHYGFPEHNAPGVKLGRHGHRNEATTPASIRRRIDAEDEAVLTRFTRRYFGERLGSALALKTCIYTNTPDENFIVDRRPSSGRTWIAAGFSGHGYKFCAGIGEILADLAAEGRTAQDISLFSADRLAG